MLKVENINSLLISYSSISKCNSKLVCSLNKIFKPVLTSKDDNENLKKLAFQYAPIAMKIFNQIIKTLSDINNDISSNKKRKIKFIDLSEDSTDNPTKKRRNNNNKINDEIINDDLDFVQNYTNEKISLIESSKITLKVLERLETYLNVKPIDIDLAHSNLITKLIEVQMVIIIIYNYIYYIIIIFHFYYYYYYNYYCNNFILFYFFFFIIFFFFFFNKLL